jgi:putative flippase GtrA
MNMLVEQALKFLAIGLLNTAFGYSLYALFLFLGLSVSISLGAATILGVLFNFKTIGTLVFKSQNNTLIFKFIFVYAITFCVNLLLIRLLMDAGMNSYVAGGVVIVPLAAASFIANKYFVFKR